MRQIRNIRKNTVVTGSSVVLYDFMLEWGNYTGVKKGKVG